jgi:hypothetical protein
MSKDHKPDDEIEYSRITKAGGEILIKNFDFV